MADLPDPLPPLLADDVLKSFAETHTTKEILAIGKRFVVPIPNLQDGGEPLELANPKELNILVRSGSLPDTLGDVKLEGFPQIVPTDGTNVVIINNVTPRQARAIQGLYDDIVAENGGKITRQSLLEFFKTATGISYDAATNSVRLEKDNIGIHGDVYNQDIATFLSRHVKVDTGDDLAASDVQAGYFEKKPSVAKGFFMKGKFRHQVGPEAGGTIQHFDDGAMVAIQSDGRVSLIHPNDVDVCYRNPDKSSLWTKHGEMDLPAYDVGDLPHDSQRAVPERGSWMIEKDDPARTAIVMRAMDLGITGTPDKAAHSLGEINLLDGRKVTAHVVHAVDAIIEDGISLVMINRKNEPGRGKPALPGGFLDPTQVAGVESAVQAAAREALEETGIVLSGGTLVGTRNMYRPHDVRVAHKDMPDYGIKQGDIFMVSTQAVRFRVDDLAQSNLIAGDDAVPGSARRVEISTLTPDSVGIPDHFDMIKQALPEHFMQGDAAQKNIPPRNKNSQERM